MYQCFLIQLQAEKASRNMETVEFRNQIEQMEANQRKREEKLLHAVREAEENHSRYTFVLSLIMSKV